MFSLMFSLAALTIYNFMFYILEEQIIVYIRPSIKSFISSLGQHFTNNYHGRREIR